MLKYIIAWFPMLVIAIMNGILREGVFRRFLNPLRAHQLSTITLIDFFAVYFWLFFRRYPPESGQQAFLVGAMWMVLTLAFEFSFGSYRGLSWAEMLADYNLAKGRIWMLIPLWLLVAPYLFYVLLRR